MSEQTIPHDISSALSYLNTQLLAHGFLTTPLQATAQIPLSEHDAHDRTVLDLINRLLNTVKEDTERREREQSTVASQIRALGQLELQLKAARARAEAGELQAAQMNQRAKTMEERAQNAEARARACEAEAKRARAAAEDVKIRYANELRRRDVEIERAKRERVQTVRKVVGVSGVFTGPDVAVKIRDSGSETPGVAKIVKDLAKENSMLYGLVYRTRLVLENVSERYDSLRELGTVDARQLDNIQHLGYDEEMGEGEARVILRTLEIDDLTQELNNALGKVASAIKQVSEESVPVETLRRREKEVLELQEQLIRVTENWEQSMKTMDEWKKFRTGEEIQL